MQFLILFVDREDAPAGAAPDRTALSALASALAREGRLLRAGRLADEAEGVRIAQRDGRALVTGGPFADGGEAVAGFWVVEAASREEAIGIARRAFACIPPRPEGRPAAVDVHVVAQRYCVAADPGPAAGPAFWLGFHNDHGLVDCDQEKLREMIACGEALERDRKLFETAPLRFAEPSARVTARGGRTLVTEGPFAEAKEVIGGYSLLRAASRAEALAIAERYPAARWGTVEVREIVECR